MLAREIMISEPLVAAAGATSAEVALLMRARDIVMQCVAAGHDPTDCPADTHARHDTTVVTPDTELVGYRIERLDVSDAHIRSTIVVVNSDKRVVGFIPHPELIHGIVIVRE